MSRQDQYSLGVKLKMGSSIIDLGIWDKMTGGEIDSEETKYKPGGMAPAISLGGSVNVGNVTISRLYKLERDHNLVPTYKGGVGKADVIVSKQPLDVDGNPFGSAVVYVGKFKTLKLPDVDSESSDAALVEIEVSSAGT